MSELATSLETDARILQSQIRATKRAIRDKKTELHDFARALAAVRERCAQHGITLIIESEGATHGFTRPVHRK